MTLEQQIEAIPGGQEGLRRKIFRIRELVDDAVRDADFRQMVVEQLARVRQRDWDGEIRAVVKFVQRMRFTRDPYAPGGLEVFVHPKTMLLQVLGGIGYGDCDDHVLLATAMLEVIGHPTRYRVGGPARGNYQHIWIEVKHPAKGWVPVELIREGLRPGFDPGPLFGHTETYAHSLGEMPAPTTMKPRPLEGLSTTTIMVAPGGKPTTQLRLERGHTTPLPSDQMRRIKWREQRAGISVHELKHSPNADNLGIWPAVIYAATTVASGYHAHSQQKRARKRAQREQQAALYERRPVAEWATQEIPAVDYTQYATALAQAGTAMYQELSYDDTQSSQHWEQRDADKWGTDTPSYLVGTEYDPQMTSEYLTPQQEQSLAQYRQGKLPGRPNFDQMWINQAEQRRKEIAMTRELANVYRQQTTTRQVNPQELMRAAPGAQTLYRRYGQPLTRFAPNVQAPVNFRDYRVPLWVQQARTAGSNPANRWQRQENYRVPDYDQQYLLQGLSDLGEDPTDPGEYQKQTPEITMPPNWEAIVDKHMVKVGNKETGPYRKHVLKAFILHAEGQGVGKQITDVKFGDTWDINTYPGPRASGRGGGAEGFQEHWGPYVINWPIAEAYVYFTILTRHHEFHAGRPANWTKQLLWLRKTAEEGIAAPWMAEELKRWEEWDKKKQEWNRFKAQRDADAARKRAAEEAEARHKAEEERLRLMREEAKRVQRAREDAERARQEMERRKREEERRAAARRRGQTIPGTTPPPLRLKGPPLIAGLSTTTTVLLAGGAALAAFLIWKK